MNKVIPREIWDKNRLLIISAVTIIILFFPTGFVHELGHILVCASNGYDYTLSVGEFALNVHCSNSPQPILLYFALGGIFGMITSLSLFLSKKIRANTGIFIGASVTAFDHFLKAIFETFTHSAYLYNWSLLIYMSVLVVFFMLGMFVFFSMRTNNKHGLDLKSK